MEPCSFSGINLHVYGELWSELAFLDFVA
jgi:hypothetical protein